MSWEKDVQIMTQNAISSKHKVTVNNEKACHLSSQETFFVVTQSDGNDRVTKGESKGSSPGVPTSILNTINHSKLLEDNFVI